MFEHVWFSGPRYNVTQTGLTIRNITEEDNGEYTCQAEVEAMGRLLERKIAVAVHSEFLNLDPLQTTDLFSLSKE